MDYITFSEFENLPIYGDFFKDNPDVGYLKVNVSTANGAFPVSGARVIITKEVGPYNVLFFSGETNDSGMIENIVLPAPPRVSNNLEMPKYTLYDLRVTHSGFQNVSGYTLGVFGDTKIIQYVRMIPEGTSNV